MTLYHQQREVPRSRTSHSNDSDLISSLIIIRKPIATISLPLISATINSTDYQQPKHLKATFNKREQFSSSSEGYQIDISLAAEFGRNLLAKIRSLQQTIKHQDQSISTLKLEKSDLQQSLNLLTDHLRCKCEKEERLSNEIWNLEKSRQAHLEQTQTLNQALARSHMDQARMIRQQTLMTQELELFKAVHESCSQNSNDNTSEGKLNRNNSSIKEKNKVATRSLSNQSIREKEQCLNTAYNDKELHQHLTIQETSEDDDDTSSYDLCSVGNSNNNKNNKQSIQQTNINHQSFIHKNGEQRQQRPHKWTCIKLASTSNIQTVHETCNEQQQQIIANQHHDVQGLSKRGGNNSRMVQHDINFSRPSTIMNSNLSAKSPSSSTWYRQKDILKTGSWVWKFTQNKTTVGISTERCHPRYIWLEPDTKILYWKKRDKTKPVKSAQIKSFLVEVSKDKKRVPTLVFQAEHREIKVQCMDLDTHCIWYQGLEDIVGLGSLRCYNKQSMVFSGESTITPCASLRPKASRLFSQNGPAMRSLKSISSFYRKGSNGNHRDSGIGSSSSMITNSNNTADYQYYSNCNNSSELRYVSKTSIPSNSQPEVSADHCTHEQQQQEQKQIRQQCTSPHNPLVRKRFLHGAQKQHQQSFASYLNKQHFYDAKTEC